MKHNLSMLSAAVFQNTRFSSAAAESLAGPPNNRSRQLPTPLNSSKDFLLASFCFRLAQRRERSSTDSMNLFLLMIPWCHKLSSCVQKPSRPKHLHLYIILEFNHRKLCFNQIFDGINTVQSKPLSIISTVNSVEPGRELCHHLLLFDLLRF